MPTKTFFNLPLEKRQKLIEAIRFEFYRIHYDEISINKIIKRADIPRGSFYQYFENKEDMLYYLLADYRQMMMCHARESLKNSGGDLCRMFLDILDFTYAFVTKGKNNIFCKNLFSDIRINTAFLRRQMREDTFGDFAQTLLPHVNCEVLDIRGPDDFDDMLEILLHLTADAFSKTFFNLSEYTEVRCRYSQRLELLKRGFLKHKQ